MPDKTPLTTQVRGEEGPVYTTQAVGEEEPQLTTLELGEEEAVTTYVLGEEGPVFTTEAVGEEEPQPTTRMLGEEEPGFGHRPLVPPGLEGDVTSAAIGEEEPGHRPLIPPGREGTVTTAAIGEEPGQGGGGGRPLEGTTMAIGEEEPGGSGGDETVTTLAVGEEGIITTLALGEEDRDADRAIQAQVPSPFGHFGSSAPRERRRPAGWLPAGRRFVAVRGVTDTSPSGPGLRAGG
jgi:hypothetical protein